MQLGNDDMELLGNSPVDCSGLVIGMLVTSISLRLNIGAEHPLIDSKWII